MAPPLRVEKPALEGRARERARAGIARSRQVGKSPVAQHAAGERARLDRRAGVRRGSGNLAARLVGIKHSPLPSDVLLSRRRKRVVALIPLFLLVLLDRALLLRRCILLRRRARGAAGLILLIHIRLLYPLLRSGVSSLRGIATAAPGSRRIVAWPALRRHVLARCRLSKPSSIAASAGLRLPLRDSR